MAPTIGSSRRPAINSSRSSTREAILSTSRAGSGWKNPSEPLPDVSSCEVPGKRDDEARGDGPESWSRMSRSACVALETEVREDYLQIYESKNRRLVTGIEFISPSNKTDHEARRALSAQAKELWASEVNVVEIDLLRAGKPLVRLPQVRAQNDPTGEIRDQHYASGQSATTSFTRLISGRDCRTWAFR